MILLLSFVGTVGVVAIFWAMLKSGFWRSLFFSLISGIGALLAVHFTSLMTGFGIPVNWSSIGISAFGGLPAVIGMIVLKFF